MIVWFGWAGALLLGSSACFAVERAPACKRLAQVSGAALLGIYAAAREDYPVLVLLGLGAVWELIALWRSRRGQRRARTVDVTIACRNFERARHAMKESLGSPSS